MTQNKYLQHCCCWTDVVNVVLVVVVFVAVDDGVRVALVDVDIDVDPMDTPKHMCTQTHIHAC